MTELKRRGPPRVGSHPMFEILNKYPDYRTNLIGGGGNTDVCPGPPLTGSECSAYFGLPWSDP